MDRGLNKPDKLYKQAQGHTDSYKILLAVDSPQHKPERMPVKINQALEETWRLRDYDLHDNIRSTWT